MLKIAEYYNKQGGSFDDAKRDSLFEKFLFKYDHQQLNQFYSVSSIFPYNFQNIEILIPVYNERSEEISEVLSDSEDTKKYKKKIKLKNNVKKLKEKVEETLEKEKKCHYNLIIEIQAFRDKLEEAENTLPPEEKESVNAKRKLDFDHSIEPAEEKKIKTNSSSPKKCDSKKSSTSKDEICYPMRELSYLTLTCLGREKSESHLIPIEQ